jgi:hypothetical protein
MKAFLRILSLCCLLVSWEVRAASDSPLIMLRNGDLWTWDEGSPTVELLTDDGFVSEPAISRQWPTPMVAYVSWSPLTRDSLSEGYLANYQPQPSDVWVFDLMTRVGQRLAPQPDSAVYLPTSAADQPYQRISPAWSTFGGELAYVEVGVIDQVAHLILVDLLENTRKELASWSGDGVPLRVFWGWESIAVISGINQKGEYLQQTLRIFYPDYVNGIRVPLRPDEPYHTTQFAWASYSDQIYFGVRYSNAEWTLIDGDGNEVSVNGEPQLRSADAQLAPQQFNLNYGSPNMPDYMQFLSPGGLAQGEPIFMGYRAQEHIALSPDGLAVAYQIPDVAGGLGYENAIRISREGRETIVPTSADVFTTSFLWGYSFLNIPLPAPPTPTPPALACPGALPLRLEPDGRGIVLLGEPNNLRDTPSLNGRVLAIIPSGGVFNVEGPPVCDGALVWWPVEYDGRQGWTAESEGQVYYVEPAS